MKDWVKEKLDQVEALYPVERVEKSKERWTKIWNGEKDYDRYPFVLYPSSFAWYDDVHTGEERLRATLDELIIHGTFDDDMIPSLFPGCKQSTIPNILGAEEIIVGNDYNCKSIINSSEDVNALPAPSLEKSPVAQSWFEMQEYFLEETEGRLPIHVVDMQGPVDVAAQIWNYDGLFVAAYTEPKVYHYLMERVTEAFIMFWKKQQKILGDNFVGTHLFGWDWVPPGMGASLSADSMMMVSPDFYNEFFKPHLERIGQVFGGLSVHSCGDFRQVIPNIMQTGNVRAINASQLTARALIDAGVDSDVVLIATLDIKDAPETAKLIKDNDLRMSITFYQQETSANSTIGQPQAWVSQDMDKAKKDAQRVADIFADL